MTAPTLRTHRLTLAVPVAGDLADSAALWADPAVYRALAPHPFGREEVWHRLLRYLGHWSAIGYGTWIVRETATGRFVGEVGLMDARRDTVPSIEGVPEAGWALAGWAQGQGFAREALAAMLNWADARPIPETTCIIDPANTRSVALAAHVGYRPAGPLVYRGGEIGLFRRQRSGGAAAQSGLDGAA